MRIVNTRSSFGIGVALVVVAATFCRAAVAQAAIDRDVVVNGGSLANPIGVGFGAWEGARVLKTSLSAAPPSTIKSAKACAPEAVIWTTINSPNPWVFQTAAVLPSEAFAVKFSGTLNGTTGGGEFGVAVSDINLECDSLNVSTLPYRAPSWSAAEDAAEYPENGSSSTAPQGMVMQLGDGWAMLGVQAHVKRASTFRLQANLNGLSNFQIADQSFNPLAVVGIDGGDRILFSETVEPGNFTATFYIKPSSSAFPGEQISVRAELIAQGPSDGQHGNKSAAARKSIDEVLVSTSGGAGLETLQVIDAQAFGPTHTPALADDPAGAPIALAFDPNAKAVFADGASVLVIRVQPRAAPANLPLMFSLQDAGGNNKNDPAFIGSLWVPAAQNNPWPLPPLPAPDPAPGAALGSLAVAGFPGANNTYYVYYRPPNNFMFGSATMDNTMAFVVRDSLGNLVATESIDLRRPSLILGHGINSGTSTFNTLRDALSKVSVKVYAFDWSQENTSGYDTVAGLLRTYIARQLLAERRHHTAATRFDYFGHSMGGVVAKWYAAVQTTNRRPRRGPDVDDTTHVTHGRDNGFTKDFNWQVDGTNDYVRDANFGTGDFHRVITVGSPLRGSPLADLVRHMGHDWVVRWMVKSAAAKKFLAATGDGYCYNDMGTTSAGCRILAAARGGAQWYPIVGVAAPQGLPGDLLPFGHGFGLALHEIATAGDTLHVGPRELLGVFGNLGLRGTNSDYIVRDRSQLDATTDTMPAADLGYYSRHRPDPPLPGPARPRLPGPPGTSWSYEVMRNATHSDELKNPRLPAYLEQALDLDYGGLPPGGTGDWVKFNPDF